MAQPATMTTIGFGVRGARELSHAVHSAHGAAEPAEIAGSFVFMASDAAYITGQVLPVDGGTVI